MIGEISQNSLDKKVWTMNSKWCLYFIVFFLFSAGNTMSQTIREYTVKKAPGKIQIDGKLNEAGWLNAETTENFVIYTDGSSPKFKTSAKMLWDEQYLYVAFIMKDEDVWGKTTEWKVGDPCLCKEEVAEVFIDPDGDGLNYIEVEINPLKAVMDLTLDKEFKKGGKGNLEWSLTGLKVGVWVDGTLNDKNDIDKQWICELAFPFKEMAFCAPGQNFPPKSGDSWRLNLYRYDYGRTAEKLTELTAWNQTDKERGFHAPNRFGRLIFSDKKALGKEK